MSTTLSQGQIFEDEVRRIARILWPTPRYQGAKLVANRERDGYFETDDAIHIVEATIERRKGKVEEDCKKTAQLVSDLRRTHKDKSVKGWLILRHEPTADQNEVARQYERTVTILPYTRFLSRIVDAPGYLQGRSVCPFGSATDPFNNNFEVPRESFVEPYLADISNSKDRDFPEFRAQACHPGARTIVLGDFGAGKSMSLRELYFRESDAYLSGSTSRFPLYLNLRSHQGQEEPVEALIRHAKFAGYQPGEDLIKAWRADLTTVILDGFDELVTPAWTQEQQKLKSHRAACVLLIANFLRESPSSTPIIVSGRTSYFNSAEEMRRTFRIISDHTVLSINDFTPQQVSSFLNKLKAQHPIPSWVPPRPLLLGYVAAYQRKHDDEVPDGAIDPATGWDMIFDRFCDRETDLARGLYKESIRDVLHRIATKARCNQSITDPIKTHEISASFAEIFDRLPDGDSLGMLLRLPGLIATESASDDRRFVDNDIGNIAAAGDVLQFILAPDSFNKDLFQNALCNVSELACDHVVRKLSSNGRSQQMIAVALEKFAREDRYLTLAGDLVKILARSEAVQLDRPLHVTNAFIDEIDLTSPPPVFQGITLDKCTIGTLRVDHSTLGDLPTMESCSIDVVQGVMDGAPLQSTLLNCSVGKFVADEYTSSRLMDLELPAGLRVFLTVLRKLYLQGGGGRVESAFRRGIAHEHRTKVPEVLELTCSHGFASKSGRPGEVVYLKNPAKTAQVLDILNRRGSVQLSIVKEVARL